jgi:hypothetical protein
MSNNRHRSIEQTAELLFDLYHLFFFVILTLDVGEEQFVDLFSNAVKGGLYASLAG